MIAAFLARLGRAGRRARLRAAGAQVGRSLQSFDDFWIGPASGFKCGADLYLSAGSKLLFGMQGGLPGRLLMGDKVFINHFTIIDCHHYIDIGNRVLIGPHCYISDFDHGMAPNRPVAEQAEGKAAPVRIGNGVWLGAGVIVLKGVTVGEDAVVGAGSVVTRDVPAKAIVKGCPARLLRMR